MAAVAPPPPALERGESRARHPRSRGERRLLKELHARLDAAIAIADTDGPAARALAGELATSARRPLALASSDAGRFASNGAGPRASLFYAPRPTAGVGLAQRGRHFAGEYDAAPIASLPPADEMALRHYGVQQLSDYARSELLGAVADYVPSHADFPGGGTARSRFDALLARVQQHQLAAVVRNELRAKEPDPMYSWDENRFHLAPATGSKRVIPLDAWAAFIRNGGEPNAAGVGLTIRADGTA